MHPILRRTALAATALLFASSAALAQANGWPKQPITLIMGFPAGSGVDVVARAVQEPLGQKLGQPIVIDYKSGAAGNIASEYVAHAKPDGYTLAFGTAATHGSNAALYKSLPFDVEADFVPVGPLIDVSNVLTINPSVIDANNLKEFVEIVKANPGKYNYASTGNGAGTHMAFAEFNARLGLDMVHVPYKGGPEAITSVLRGETCCIMNQVQTVLAHYKSGKVRLLGITTAKPVDAVKEVPTIAASGLPGTKGFDSSIWFGVFAPKGTPNAVLNQIRQAVDTVHHQPKIQQRLAAQHLHLPQRPASSSFAAVVQQDYQRWSQHFRVAVSAK